MTPSVNAMAALAQYENTGVQMAGALWKELRAAEYVTTDGILTGSGHAYLDAYRTERDKDAPKPAAKVAPDKTPSDFEPLPEQPARNAAELVLWIQYEECLRLARDQRSDYIWAAVGARKSQLEALRAAG